jgi:hypothetical protein
LEVTIYNSKDKDITVNLRQYMGNGSTIEQSTAKFVAESATSQYAGVAVAHHGQTVVRFTVKSRIN